MNLSELIEGLHHVTATVNDAQQDYDFYTKTLGLRLVKETVNFDNEQVYHFYYGNKIGSPSTLFTTFPYKDQGVPDGRIGTGQVSQTAFSVPIDSLGFWEARLREHGVAFAKENRLGWDVLNFQDPSGLRIQLVATAADQREPVWTHDEISATAAIGGIHHVVLLVDNPAPTQAFLEVFGYRLLRTAGNRQLYAAGAGGPGDLLVLHADADAPRGYGGMGTVHHVAHRVADEGVSRRIKAFLEGRLGLRVTDVLDRKYFRSIYFRIPGGILFEVATAGPGFLVDEDEVALGTSLKLPDWQEPRRARIAAELLKYER